MTDGNSSKEKIQSLFNLYSNDVYRYAWATLGNTTDAQDIVQEVFLRAYRSLNTYRREASSKTWLMTIARNCIFDILRKRRIERKYLVECEMPEVGDVSDVSMSLCDLMEVEEALCQLKETYKQVIILRHIENFSCAETAKILGWSETKVRTTTHRAMAKLREILDGTAVEVN